MGLAGLSVVEWGVGHFREGVSKNVYHQTYTKLGKSRPFSICNSGERFVHGLRGNRPSTAFYPETDVCEVWKLSDMPLLSTIAAHCVGSMV